MCSILKSGLPLGYRTATMSIWQALHLVPHHHPLLLEQYQMDRKQSATALETHRGRFFQQINKFNVFACVSNPEQYFCMFGRTFQNTKLVRKSLLQPSEHRASWDLRRGVPLNYTKAKNSNTVRRSGSKPRIPAECTTKWRHRDISKQLCFLSFPFHFPKGNTALA